MRPEFEVRDTDLAGRIGRIRLASGRVVETPAFFPVIDPIRQEVPLSEIREAGFDQVITNAYLLLKRHGWPSQGQSVHYMLGWDGAVMTDSGAYQILEYGDIDVDQRTILEYQKRIATDIGVILDIPTGDVERGEALATVKRTLERAREALEVIDPVNDDILWMLPIQGGRHLDLLEYSARESVRLPYRMYGIGSPTVFLEEYKYEVITDMIYTVKRILPWTRPVHLFGAGHPLIMPFAIALGVDTFDSASYILYARDDRYMTDTGVYRLKELDYFPCNCPVCSKFTPEDLRELPKSERTRLLAIHNLHAIRRSIERAKQAIREGRLWELLEHTARAHPSAMRAFRKFRKYYRLLERGTASSKGTVKGLRAYGVESLWNPRILRFKSRILAEYIPSVSEFYRGKRVVLTRMPRDSSKCRPSSENHYLVYYTPYLGLVPSELCGVYPTIQLDYAIVTREVAEDLANTIVAAIHKMLSKGASLIVIEVDEDSLGMMLKKRLSGIRGVEIRTRRLRAA